MSSSPSPTDKAAALIEIASPHATPETVAWLRGGVPSADKPFARGVFFGFFAGIGRRTSAAAAPGTLFSADDIARLKALGVHAPEVWSLADVFRAALLLAACGVLPGDQHVGLAREAFLKGDNGEKIAVLRSLSILPDPQRFEAVAAESCRSHVLDVFTAIANDNPYPARCMSQPTFNQLVVKALFLEVPLSRLPGLAERKNSELYRMARDYETERRAAGRVITPDTVYVAHTLEKTA